jgi:hypothetical protein
MMLEAMLASLQHEMWQSQRGCLHSPFSTNDVCDITSDDRAEEGTAGQD